MKKSKVKKGEKNPVPEWRSPDYCCKYYPTSCFKEEYRKDSCKALMKIWLTIFKKKLTQELGLTKRPIKRVGRVMFIEEWPGNYEGSFKRFSYVFERSPRPTFIDETETMTKEFREKNHSSEKERKVTRLRVRDQSSHSNKHSI